jgi:hypothetical protein
VSDDAHHAWKLLGVGAQKVQYQLDIFPVTVHVTDTTLTIEAGDDIRTVAPTTTQTVRDVRPMRPRKAAL